MTENPHLVATLATAAAAEKAGEGQAPAQK